MRAFQSEKQYEKGLKTSSRAEQSEEKKKKKKERAFQPLWLEGFFICSAKSCEGDLCVEYTETKSVYVYTETKNVTYYIYIIVGNKKHTARILRAGDRFSRKKAAAKPKFFLDNPRAM